MRDPIESKQSTTTEETIFQAAAALPKAERGAYLDAACAGQPEIRSRIEALLRSHEATGFMEAGATEARLPDLAGERARFQPERVGERIGRYRLLEEIGEGGFGVVWMAEQVDPVSRCVALKIIKPGMDTKEVIARFEAERQALAMMEHPNIAKVFDAGATDKGRLFFVMELVKGIPITQFCDEREFTTRQRLGLFADVCSAISHAHQKGVIHRDIKPSNVMVRLNGDGPAVKVIDFGIAKATRGKLTDRTLFTRFEHFLGTPAYMSPEQAAISELDIDTRSDIYALGILLYELLTGKPPFDAKSLLSAGYEEMRRIIREVEPPRPSSRLSTIAGDERTVVAKARQIMPEKLSRLIEPDLDWIVMKAIEKDRSRRYETANGLALDIQRFLSDEPVSAGPPTAAYRFRKFAQRHKASLRIGAAIAIILVTVTIVNPALAVLVYDKLTWGSLTITLAGLVAATFASAGRAARAALAEKRAAKNACDEKVEREAAEAVSNFLCNLFQCTEPARGGPAITAAQSLDRAVKNLDTEFASRPAQRATLQIALSDIYFALGQYRDAVALLEKAKHYYLSTLGSEHPGTLKTIQRLEVFYHEIGRLDEAPEPGEGSVSHRSTE